MKRLSSSIIPVLLLVLPTVAIYLLHGRYGGILTHPSAFWAFCFKRFPYVALGIVGVLGWHFNQTRISFLCLLLAGIFVGIQFQPDSPLFSIFFRSLGLCIAYVLFFYAKERSVLSPSVLPKFLLLAGVLLFPLRYDRIAFLKNMEEAFLDPSSHHYTLPGTDVPAVILGAILLVFCVSVVMLAIHEGSTHRGMRGSFMASLGAALLAITGHVGFWPKHSGSEVASIYTIASALLLLYAIYSLFWGRAYTDELTGQSNRRALEEALDRLGRRYAIAMIDIDHFKKFNDSYGHQVGDEVLRFVASRIEKSKIGRVYRYGGEEFSIVCPRRDAQSIFPELDELREHVASCRLVLRAHPRTPEMRGKKNSTSDGLKRISITISIGVAERNREQCTPDLVIEAADKALYAAKEQGRNRVVCDPSSE